MRRALLSLVLLLVWGVPAAAQTPKRPLTLAAYYQVKSVGSPRISPDGRWVTYTVSTPVEATNTSTTETWLVKADGSAQPILIRHYGQNVTNPRWRDDGRLLATHLDADWAFDPAQPTAPPTRAATPSGNGVLSLGGRWLARTQPLPRQAPPAPSMDEFEKRHEERFKGDQIDWYPFLQDGEEFPSPDGRARPLTEIFLQPGDGSGSARQLTRLGLRPENLQWRPDGGAILFTADEADLDEMAFGRSDLFLVTTDGQVTRLTDDAFEYSRASFSPDGRWITYTRSLGHDTIVTPPRLPDGGPRDFFVRPASGGEPVNLTADWDLDAGSPQWSPDSRYLYFTAGIGGANHLFRVPAAGGPVEQVTTGERRLNGITFDKAFRRITYTVGEFDRPSDVWTADIDGRNERRLTDVHKDFLDAFQIATRPPEAIRWNSTDGTPVEGFLLFPHGYDPQRGPYPLIVMNHGGPHSASGYGFNFKHSYFNANGYFVFLPNFRSSSGYGDAFKWGTWGAWGTNDGEDVVSGIDHLVANYAIDASRVGAMGHSYGGILTNWLITRYPDRFKAAIPGAGESNWTSNYALRDGAGGTKEEEFGGRPWEPEALEIMIRQSPYFHCADTKAATLFVHGDVDYRVPLSGALQLYTCLKKQRVPTKLLIYEGMPHSISGHWNNVHRMMHELRWWETYLKPTGPVRADGGA
jgi:dipeptidyl aminopeptidase/acylaminoacyl peptidase